MSVGPWCVVACLALVSASCSNQPEAEAAAAEPLSASVQSGGTAVPHGDHRPHYGGVVMMKGDLHFEVVLGANGTHRVYFSDAVRAELPASVASEVTLTVSGPAMAIETLRGIVDDSGESWIARGSPLTGDGVVARVAFVVDRMPYWIDVPFSAAR
jgi:hypothetical protein